MGYGRARFGRVRLGRARLNEVRLDAAQLGWSWYGTEWQGRSWCDEAGHGTAGIGEVRLGKVWISSDDNNSPVFIEIHTTSKRSEYASSYQIVELLSDLEILWRHSRNWHTHRITTSTDHVPR